MSSCSLQKICICRDAASSFVRLEDCVPSPASPIPALWQSCARPSQTPSVCTMSPKGGYTLRILRVRLYINCLASKLPARGQGVPTSAWLPQPFYTRMHARVHARPNCKRFNQFGRACISIPDTERPRACTVHVRAGPRVPRGCRSFRACPDHPDNAGPPAQRGE
jgi:hypothetical protein